MALNDKQSEKETIGFFGSTAFIAGTSVLAGIVLVHGYKLYQDLVTQDRSSVSHRRTKPEKTIPYKIIGVLTMFAVFVYFIQLLGGTIGYFSDTNMECDYQLTWIFSTYQIAKTSMYLVFITRLYNIYQASTYSYPLKCIKFFAVLLVVLCCIALILLISVTTSKVADYGDDAYPNLCLPGQDNLFYIVGALLFFQDVGAAVGFLWGYMIPLRKTLAILDDKTSKNAKIARKIIKFGTKTAILTAVSTISTVSFTIIVILTGVGFIAIGDIIINTICMILMTPYYPDYMFYRPLCCLCMQCCDKRGTQLSTELAEAINDNDDNENDDENKKKEDNFSIDTMSQLRFLGQKLKVQYHHNYQNLDDNNNNEMKEITPEPVVQQQNDTVNNEEEQP